MKNDQMNLENTALGTAVIGGVATSAAGVIAAGTATTSAISAVGAAVGSAAGGVAGAIAGSGFGIATGGAAMAATAPLAAAGATIGATIGGWAGPALAVFGIGTAPVWAVPMAIGGGLLATGGAAIAGYRYIKRRHHTDSTGV